GVSHLSGDVAVSNSPEPAEEHLAEKRADDRALEDRAEVLGIADAGQVRSRDLVGGCSVDIEMIEHRPVTEFDHRGHSLNDQPPRVIGFAGLPLSLIQHLVEASVRLLPGGVFTHPCLVTERAEDKAQQPQGLAARSVELLQYLPGLGYGHTANGDQCPDQAQPAHVRFTVLRPLDLLAAAPRQQLFTDVVLDSGNGDARPLAQVRDPHVFPLFLITPRGRQPILDSAVSSRLSPEVPMSGIASLYGSLRVHRPLLIATLLSLGVTLAAVVGLFVDGRELVGA